MSPLSFHLLYLAVSGASPVPSTQADAIDHERPSEALEQGPSQALTRPFALALSPREVKPPPPLYDSEERQRRDNREYRRNRHRDRDYDLNYDHDYDRDLDSDPDRSRRSRRSRSHRSRDRHDRYDRRRSNRHRGQGYNEHSSRHRGRREHRSANYYYDDGHDDRYDDRRNTRRTSEHRSSGHRSHQGRSGEQYEQARYQRSQQSRSSSSSTSKQRVRKEYESQSNEGPQHLLELGFGPFGHWWGAEISYLYHLRGGSVGPAVGAIVSGSSAPGVQSFSVGGKFQWDFDLFPNQSLKFYAGPFAGLSYQWEKSMRTDIGATLRMVVQERWTLFVQPVALSVFTYLGKGGPGVDRFWPAYHGAAGIGVVF